MVASASILFGTNLYLERHKTNTMKILFVLFMLMSTLLMLSACGSGDTGDGYMADTTALNPASGNIDSSIAPAAGDRGNPDSTIGATTNTKAPDSNNTNQNVRD